MIGRRSGGGDRSSEVGGLSAAERRQGGGGSSSSDARTYVRVCVCVRAGWSLCVREAGWGVRVRESRSLAGGSSTRVTPTPTRPFGFFAPLLALRPPALSPSCWPASPSPCPRQPFLSLALKPPFPSRRMSAVPSRPPSSARGGSTAPSGSRQWTRGGGSSAAGGSARNQSVVFNASGTPVPPSSSSASSSSNGRGRGAPRGRGIRGRGRGRGGGGGGSNALALAGALADDDDGAPSADADDGDEELELNDDGPAAAEDEPYEGAKADKADARLQRFTSKFEGNRFEEVRRCAPSPCALPSPLCNITSLGPACSGRLPAPPPRRPTC